MNVAVARGPPYSLRSRPAASEARYPSYAAGTARSRSTTAAQSSSVAVGVSVKTSVMLWAGDERLETVRSPSSASCTASSAVSRSRSSRPQRRSASLSAPGSRSAASSSRRVARRRSAAAAWPAGEKSGSRRELSGTPR